MAHYLVRARPNWEKLDELRARVDSGEVVEMRPFGRSLDYSLREARLEGDQVAIWEEEDYCNPPLDMERRAVLDYYFEDIRVEPVQRDEGWARIEALPDMWSNAPQS